MMGLLLSLFIIMATFSCSSPLFETENSNEWYGNKIGRQQQPTLIFLFNQLLSFRMLGRVSGGGGGGGGGGDVPSWLCDHCCFEGPRLTPCRPRSTSCRPRSTPFRPRSMSSTPSREGLLLHVYLRYYMVKTKENMRLLSQKQNS